MLRVSQEKTNEARRLMSDERLSVTQIAERVSLGRTTIARIVKDIPLSQQERKAV
jgi:hypothetical protein